MSPAVAFEGDRCVGILGDNELRHILALTTQGVTHAITVIWCIWEANLRVGLSDLLSWALDSGGGNLDILVKVDSAIARELQHHVKDERNRAVKLARESSLGAKSLL